MSLRRIYAIMRKEFIQISRDVRSLLIIFAIPLILLFIYGYAVNLDVKHIPLCIYDRDGSQDSQDLLKAFQATEYFNIVHLARDYPDVVRQIDTGACAIAIVIPVRFSQDLRQGGGTSVQAILDASDSNSASIGLGYAQGIVAAYSSRVQVDWARHRGAAPPVPPIDIRARTWFNEDLESMANIVPGVVALVMAVAPRCCERRHIKISAYAQAPGAGYEQPPGRRYRHNSGSPGRASSGKHSTIVKPAGGRAASAITCE